MSYKYLLSIIGIYLLSTFTIACTSKQFDLYADVTVSLKLHESLEYINKSNFVGMEIIIQEYETSEIYTAQVDENLDAHFRLPIARMYPPMMRDLTKYIDGLGLVTFSFGSDFSSDYARISSWTISQGVYKYELIVNLK